MLQIHQDYLTDENGNKKAVVIPLAEWQKIIEKLEELEDIKAYDKAKSTTSEIVPLEEVVQQIQQRT
jgi:PHD/YefM family antitoxin component YafN of YafNO toxin-antitoxin module